MGRVLVIPIYPSHPALPNGTVSRPQPSLLIALHGEDNVPWGLLRLKVRLLLDCLRCSLTASLQARALALYMSAPLGTLGARFTDESSPPIPLTVGGGIGRRR